MVKVSTKRKAAPRQDEIPESIFDALNANPPGQEQPTRRAETDGTGIAPARQTQAKAGEPTMADLMKQIEDLNRRADSAERANIALSTAAPTVVNTPTEPKFNLENLPDPLDDKDGYARELASRTAKFNQTMIEYHNASQASRASQGGNSEQLWEDFSSEYEQYAADKEGVEFATQQAIKLAQRRGMDVNKYMYQNSDRFFRDVVKVYDKRFGKPEDDDEVEEQPAPRRKAAARQEEPEDEPNRTGGIFGGIDGSGGNRTPRAPQPGDMIKDLQDIQRKTGYY